MLSYSDELAEIYYKKYFKKSFGRAECFIVSNDKTVCEFLRAYNAGKRKKRTPNNKLLPDDLKKSGEKNKYSPAIKKKTLSKKIFVTQMKDLLK
jgi:hypothetical protein